MSPSRTVLLHLSDIHFVKDKSGTRLDIDADVRNELLIDAQGLARDLGSVHGVVVSGDIAFAGKPEEYEIAVRWLAELANAVGCPPNRTWLTPGNHDVDWEQIDLTLELVHERLRSIDPLRINDQLTTFLRDPNVGAALLRPLHAYRGFAGLQGCGFSAEQPFWEQDLPLNDGSILRVRGVTSTLVSSRGDRKGLMVLGLAPATLPRRDGVEYMVLCHHPMDWFREQEELDNRLPTRARILLFGHKHLQRLRREEDCVVLTAGAVHPFRNERLWKPRYNWLALRVEESADGERQLEVKVFQRVWSEGEQRFEPDSYHGAVSRRFTFEIAPWSGAGAAIGRGECLTTPAQTRSDAEIVIHLAAEAVHDQAAQREVMDAALRLAERFWRLPYHVRFRILRQLELIESHEKTLPEEERIVRAFRRARELGKLEALEAAVESHGDQRSENRGEAGAA